MTLSSFAFASDTRLSCTVNLEQWYQKYLTANLVTVPVTIENKEIDIAGNPFLFKVVKIEGLTYINDELPLEKEDSSSFFFRAQPTISKNEWFLNFERLIYLNRLSGEFQYSIFNNKNNTMLLHAAGTCKPFKQIF